MFEFDPVLLALKQYLGTFLIILGYTMSILERFLGMSFWGYPYQNGGMNNGFTTTIAGAFFIANSVQQFFLISLPAIVVSLILQKITVEYLKKREKHFIGKEGIAQTDMKRKCKGFVDFNGEIQKVFPEIEDIKKGELVYVSDLIGSRLMIRKLK